MANATPHLLPRGERLLQGAIADFLSDSATEIEVNNPPSVDELPTYFELDPSSDNPETIRVYDVSSNTIYFERGVYSSGVGREHLPNTPYKQKVTSQHWQKVVDAVEQGYLPEDPSITITRDSTTQFTIEGVDRTDYYTLGRILRINGSDANIVVVLSSTLAGSDTEVTIDSAYTLPTPVTTVELAIFARGAMDELVLKGATQTLTNKTLTAPVLNGAMTGTGVLDEDTMSSNSATALATQQSIKAYVDASGAGGWSTYSAVVPTRASADDPTYVLTFAGVDLTSTMYPGMRIKWTQNSTVRYAIITAVAFSTNTTMTVYGGTDYDVDDTATYTISAFSYSSAKSPAGFPTSPVKWMVETADTSTANQGSPTGGTWYNLGTITIVCPIGVWRRRYEVVAEPRKGAATDNDMAVTLSTANNSQSDAKMTGYVYASTVATVSQTVGREDIYTAASKTTLYLNAKTNISSMNSLYFRGDVATTVIRLVSAYL